MEKKYFVKASIILFMAALFELYSIQQLATGVRMFSITWTLSFAFTGLALIIPSLVYTFLGLMTMIFKGEEKFELTSSDKT